MKGQKSKHPFLSKAAPSGQGLNTTIYIQKIDHCAESGISHMNLLKPVLERDEEVQVK